MTAAATVHADKATAAAVPAAPFVVSGVGVGWRF